MKIALAYHRARGQGERTLFVSRERAYHGVNMGGVALSGILKNREGFGPGGPGVVHMRHTLLPENRMTPGQPEKGAELAEDLARLCGVVGGSQVAAVFLEPIAGSTGCLPPPRGYLERVREICDRHDVLLVADETICAFGRIGEPFAIARFNTVPDIITCAKGMTSGYAPMGAMIASDRLFEPFAHGTTTFLHGYTWGGHPVGAAVALANLDLMEREDLYGNVRRNEAAFRATLEKLLDIPIVGDVRGEGYFYGIELVKDKQTKATFSEDEAERLLRGYLSKALYDNGLYCRADDRGDPVIQLAPPLIIGQPEFDEIEQILRQVLTEGLELL